MGQRINIQYSIDIEELPGEVGRMVAATAQKIESTSNILSNFEGHDLLTLETIENIDIVRLELAAADHMLRDASAIVSSYVAFKAESARPSEEQDIDPSVLSELLERSAGNEVATEG